MLGMFEDKDKVAAFVINGLNPERLKQVSEGGHVDVDQGLKQSGEQAFMALKNNDHQSFTESLVNMFRLLQSKEDSLKSECSESNF